jgi:hypothetical protein
VWAAGAAEDAEAVAKITGEPVIDTMSLESVSGSSFKIEKDAEKVTAFQLWQVQKRKRDLREEYLEHWNATIAETGTGRPVDAILCPAAPYAAPPHGNNRWDPP